MVNPLPPRQLALAPGDKITLSTTVEVLSDLSNVATKPLRDGFRLVAVVRRADGTTRRSAPVIDATTIVNRLLVGGVTAADDGAMAFVEVSRTRCSEDIVRVSSTEIWLGGSTTLSVSAATPSLVAQDTQAPSEVHAVYPPTPKGAPVTVTLSALEGGGGRRAAGTGTRPTNVTYAWFDKPGLGDVSLVLRAGETGPALSLLAARPYCWDIDCARKTKFRMICHNRPHLVAEVCNTVGCTRSAEVMPAVIAPAPRVEDQERSLAHDSCMWA